MMARERAEAEITQQRADSERRRLEREARETAAGEEIAALVNRVAEGDLSGRVDESGKEGFFLSASQQLNRLPANLQTMAGELADGMGAIDRKSQRLNSSHYCASSMTSSTLQQKKMLH